MNYLLSIIPDFSTWTTSHIIIGVVAVLGVILHIYGVFLETERRQDLVFMIAAGCLFVYATYIQNKIFAIAMFGFGLGSAIEFIEIMMGIHKEPIVPGKSFVNPKEKIYKV